MGGVLAPEGSAAKAARASQQSSVPMRERKQCQPPSFFWWRTSHSIAGFIRGSFKYPNRAIMRTAFPVMHTSLLGPPRSPVREKRFRNRPIAFATRGGLLRQAQVRKDEQPPVRCYVLGSVQIECGGARVHPLSRRVLSPQDLSGPSLPPDFPLCADDRGIVGRSVEKIPQHPETDARVRFLREQPSAEPLAQDHVALGTREFYLCSPWEVKLGGRCDRVLWAEPFQRVSRLSSAWSERVTVECSRARSRARCPLPSSGRRFKSGRRAV